MAVRLESPTDTAQNTHQRLGSTNAASRLTASTTAANGDASAKRSCTTTRSVFTAEPKARTYWLRKSITSNSAEAGRPDAEATPGTFEGAVCELDEQHIKITLSNVVTREQAETRLREAPVYVVGRWVEAPLEDVLDVLFPTTGAGEP